MSVGHTSSQMALRDPDIRLMLRVRDGDDTAAFSELVERFQHYGFVGIPFGNATVGRVPDDARPDDPAKVAN